MKSTYVTTKAKACKGVGQKWSPKVTFHAPTSVGKCEGMNPHTPKWAFILGVGVSRTPNGLPNFQRVITGVKIHWIEKIVISLKKI